MAASYSSAGPSPHRYHVFLSFRGEDTRKSFTDFLYEALERAGIHTFRDDNDIGRGKPIEAEIRRGIMESKLSIIVLSKGYASSQWCLDELVLIMDRARADMWHLVLPIFYDVVPDQVLGQTDSYAEAFAQHQKEFEAQKVDGWRKALRDVANLAGMVLGGRHETQFIHEVVQIVGEKLYGKPQHGPGWFGAEANNTGLQRNPGLNDAAPSMNNPSYNGPRMMNAWQNPWPNDQGSWIHPPFLYNGSRMNPLNNGPQMNSSYYGSSQMNPWWNHGAPMNPSSDTPRNNNNNNINTNNINIK